MMFILVSRAFPRQAFDTVALLAKVVPGNRTEFNSHVKTRIKTAFRTFKLSAAPFSPSFP
jgi:hypothetical protein